MVGYMKSIFYDCQNLNNEKKSKHGGVFLNIKIEATNGVV